MYQLIDTQADMDALASALTGVIESVAVDTEFLREKTYLAKLCLIQLGVADKQYCIDVLNVDDLSLLTQLFENQQVVKIFHAARQDVEVIVQTLGVLPRPVFDTQLAAAFCGADRQISYAGMVKQWLDVALQKGQTRTDWSQRPLAQAQLQYAAEDVAYLHQLHALTDQRIRQSGKLDWFHAESDNFYLLEQYQSWPETAYQRLYAGDLPRHQQHLVKAIAQWREQQAQQRDIPRTWVLKDSAIYQLAQSGAQTEQAILDLGIFGKKSAQKQAQSVLQVMMSVDVGDDLIWQPVEPLGKQDKQHCREMMQIVTARAEQLDMAQGLLATRRDIESLYRNGSSNRLLSGWRKAAIGDQLSTYCQAIN